MMVKNLQSKNNMHITLLIDFNVAPTSEVVTKPDCSSRYIGQSAATLECHATDTGHDTPPFHNIDSGADLQLCYPLIFIITIEYTTTHLCRRSDLTEKSSDLPHMNHLFSKGALYCSCTASLTDFVFRYMRL